MSRFAQNIAPALKVLLVVGIIAAWVEANAQWLRTENAPSAASVFSKAPPSPGFDPFQRSEKQAPAAGGNCTPSTDNRGVTRLAPPRPAVIKT
jgi:hypothetical protein